MPVSMPVSVSMRGASTRTRSSSSSRCIRPRQRRGSRRRRYRRARRDRRVPRWSRSGCLGGRLRVWCIRSRGDDDRWIPCFAWGWSRWYATSPFFTSLLFFPLSLSLFPFPISPLFSPDAPTRAHASSCAPTSPRGSTMFLPTTGGTTSNAPPRTRTPCLSRRKRPRIQYQLIQMSRQPGCRRNVRSWDEPINVGRPASSMGGRLGG